MTIVGVPNMEMHERIARLYAALGETVDSEVASFAPTIIDGGRAARYEFSGGLTDEQIANRALQAVDHVAHLRDPLGKWAEANGKNRNEVKTTIQGSMDLCLVVDISNGHKHGYPLRTSWSGKQPRLSGFMRALNIGAGSGPGTVELVPGLGGLDVHTTGASAPRVEITAAVLDHDGTRLGNLSTILEKALSAWEKLLTNWKLL